MKILIMVQLDNNAIVGPFGTLESAEAYILERKYRQQHYYVRLQGKKLSDYFEAIDKHLQQSAQAELVFDHILDAEICAVLKSMYKRVRVSKNFRTQETTLEVER